jgi:hypothetical protein
MAYVRCATGECKFRDPAGQLGDDLPEPRRKKGAPADTPTNRLDPSWLVYDVLTDGTKKCTGACSCYIVIQFINTDTGKPASEIVRSADGDDKNALTKREHDTWVRDNTKAKNHREVKFLAACLETEQEEGKRVPKQV